MLVRELMHESPVVVHPGTSTKEALGLLDRHLITSMPVVDENGRIVGVVSEGDLVRDSAPPDARAHMIPVQDAGPAASHRIVGEVMNRHPVVVHGGTDVAEAVELMTSTAVKSLPVLDERRRVVGVVSRRDVVHLLARDDDRIEQDIDELFRSTGVDWLVRVADGHAIVSGPEQPHERALAEALAVSVLGVTTVGFDDDPPPPS